MSDTPNRPRITREQAQAAWNKIRADQREGKSDEPAPPPEVSWDYRNRAREAVERALEAKNITRGVSVNLARDVPLLVVICGKHAQKADCQVAFEDGVEPEELGRKMAEAFEENIEAVRRGEIE